MEPCTRRYLLSEMLLMCPHYVYCGYKVQKYAKYPLFEWTYVVVFDQGPIGFMCELQVA